MERALRLARLDVRQLLVDVSQRLETAATVDDVAQHAHDAVVAAGAAHASVYLGGDDELVSLPVRRGRHERGLSLARLPLDGPSPAAHAARSGEHVLLASWAETVECFPAYARLLGADDPRRGAAVALALRAGRVRGAVAWTLDGAVALDAADRELLGVLGLQVAQALDRALALGARGGSARPVAGGDAHAGEGRVRLLQRFAGALAAEPDVPGVCACISGHVNGALRAAGATVRLDEPDAASAAPRPAGSRDTGDATVVTVPIPRHQGVIGVVQVRLAQGRVLAEQELLLLHTLAAIGGQALERALFVEREARARADAAVARRRAERVRDIQQELAGVLDSRGILEVLWARLQTTSDAIGAALVLPDAHGEHVVLTAGALPHWTQRVLCPGEAAPTAAVTADGRARFYASTEDLAEAFPGVATALASCGSASAAYLPLQLIDGQRGCVAVNYASRHLFDFQERLLLAELAAGVEHAAARTLPFERERRTSLFLQRSMLGRPLPGVPGLAISATYEPGGDGVEIGGDWYEVLQRADGTVLLTVGDVSGKGVEAAVRMSRYRHACALLALEGIPPAEILQRVGRIVDDGIATVACLSIDPLTGDVRYATAGHPYPLLLDRETGAAAWLDAAQNPVLGLGTRVHGREARLRLSEGSAVAVYTDGLVEMPGQPLVVGMGALARAGRQMADRGLPEAATLVDLMRPEGEFHDDIAVVVVRLGEPPHEVEATVPATAAGAAALARRLEGWLERLGVDAGRRHDAVGAIAARLDGQLAAAPDAGEPVPQATLRASLEGALLRAWIGAAGQHETADALCLDLAGARSYC